MESPSLWKPGTCWLWISSYSDLWRYGIIAVSTEFSYCCFWPFIRDWVGMRKPSAGTQWQRWIWLWYTHIILSIANLEILYQGGYQPLGRPRYFAFGYIHWIKNVLSRKWRGKLECVKSFRFIVELPHWKGWRPRVLYQHVTITLLGEASTATGSG
jgi:hypothetical protein